LTVLSLFQNHLRELPLEMGRLFRLKALNIDANPILHPPHNILRTGVESTIGYLRERMPTPPPPERNWKIIQSELHNEEAEGIKFKVFCYNILAPIYATSGQHYYCPRWALDWEYRKKLLLRQFKAHNPDILCLQEIEAKQYGEYFMPALSQCGYNGFFTPKSRAKTVDDPNHVDGCAIFFKRQRFDVIEEHFLEFQSLAMNKYKQIVNNKQHSVPDSGLERLITKDNIAIALLLQLKQPQNSSNTTGAHRVLFSNTHIHWDPLAPDVKLMQTQLLVEELMKINNKYKRERKNQSRKSGALMDEGKLDEDSVPVVIAGDFNSMPDSQVYQFLLKGSLEPTSPSISTSTTNGLDSSSSPQTPNIYSTDPRERESSGFKGLNHNLSLASSYGSSPIGEPPFTNYTSDFYGVLDYIWYTTPTLKVTGLLEHVNKSELFSPFPNPHFPSDHIPLLAEFQFLERTSSKENNSTLLSSPALFQ